jgi:hypothetical protein
MIILGSSTGGAAAAAAAAVAAADAEAERAVAEAEAEALAAGLADAAHGQFIVLSLATALLTDV